MENIKVQIREATEADIPAIQQITHEAFLDYQKLAGLSGRLDALTETEEDIRSDIRHKLVLVALLDGVPVGSVRIAVRKDKVAYLSRFGVRVDCQKHGVGRALMTAVDGYMQEKEMKQLRLHTASKVFSLVRFYYGCGFYIHSTATDRGYIRALLCKDYE